MRAVQIRTVFGWAAHPRVLNAARCWNRRTNTVSASTRTQRRTRPVFAICTRGPRPSALAQPLARRCGRTSFSASASLSCLVVFSSSSAASCIGSTLIPPCLRTRAVMSSKRSSVSRARGTSRRSVHRGSVGRPSPAGTRNWLRRPQEAASRRSNRPSRKPYPCARLRVPQRSDPCRAFSSSSTPPRSPGWRSTRHRPPNRPLLGERRDPSSCRSLQARQGS